MRILVLTTWFPSERRPSQAPFNLKHVEAIARHHDVSVVHVRLQSSEKSGLESYQGFRVLRLSLDLKRPWSIIAVIRGIRYADPEAQVLHTMAFSSVLFGVLSGLGHRTPWVHSEHWNGVVNPSSVSPLWARLAWLRRLLRRPDWLTGVTQQLSRTLTEFGREDSTTVVPCVIENPLEIVERRSATRIHLVAVGALIARKRPLTAVATLKWLREQGHDVEMIWVGDGPQRAEVEQAIAVTGLSDRFTITGFVQPDEVFGYFQRANLFYLPTEQENFFTSAAEALSAGIPVVAPRVGGFDDYADASNSVLVEPSEATPERFGQAILEAFKRFAGVSPLAIATPIRARFSKERIGAQFDEIYAAITKVDR